jgi:predicted amidohydrolase YtcJ
MNNITLINGHVITMNPAMPLARFVVIRNGLITEVGHGEAPLPVRQDREGEVIDCAGMTVIPGFIDAHCHVVSYAGSLVGLDLSPACDMTSISDIQNKVARAAAGTPQGSWIRGKRYNEFYLSEKRHPNRRDLDEVAPHHPVRLSHRSGHAHVLNSLALARVGITMETGDPPDGLIERDLSTGEPTGLLYGMGSYLAERIPPLDNKELEEGLSQVNQKLLSRGITSVCDASVHNGQHQWDQFVDWMDRGIITVRLTMMTGPRDDDYVPIYPPPQFNLTNHLHQGPVKIIIHHVTGQMSPSQDELDTMVRAAHEANRQVAIHAIEPNEIEAACNAIDKALQIKPQNDHRHRIEHCSVCPDPLLGRIHGLGITLVTQPSFIYFHGDRYLATVAENERQYLYRIGAMARHGITVAGSSDFPMTDANPFFGIFSAVTRKTKEGRVVLPEEASSPYEALSMYTTQAAAACRQEHIKGSIEPGKLGDLVICDSDPLSIDGESIKNIKVITTVVGGRAVWNQNE